MKKLTIGFFDIAWPTNVRYAPTPEQLLDNGRVDGIVAIYASVWADRRVRSALGKYKGKRMPLMPEKTFLWD